MSVFTVSNVSAFFRRVYRRLSFFESHSFHFRSANEPMCCANAPSAAVKRTFSELSREASPTPLPSAKDTCLVRTSFLLLRKRGYRGRAVSDQWTSPFFCPTAIWMTERFGSRGGDGHEGRIHTQRGHRASQKNTMGVRGGQVQAWAKGRRYTIHKLFLFKRAFGVIFFSTTERISGTGPIFNSRILRALRRLGPPRVLRNGPSVLAVSGP